MHEQVIVLQLFPDLDCDQAYVERWSICLNGSIKNEIYIDFHGYAECPNIVVNNFNSVNFGNVNVGIEKTLSVAIRNITRHHSLQVF